ncbi:MAG: undecaprenyl-diphosphate phosphatase [Clostridia bacterium]|nr:undecaprenyl-diphosphate phosphatase [Clostridia bacterium]
MNIIQGIILGIVQGLTEFLPVSSSAHLNIFPWIFNWGEMGDSFDLALHVGTLIALIVFFFKDWINLFKAGYKQAIKKEKTTEGRIFWCIVISTIVAGIASLVLDKISEKIIEFIANMCGLGENTLPVEMPIIAIALIVMGIVLYIVDKKSKSDKKYSDITFKQSVLIAASQALAAAFPGVSRSGITMTVARAQGIDRESSARFSFLLSAPIIAAAALVKITHFTFDLSLLVGILASFIVGFFVIKFLLNYLKKGSYKVFAIYRIVLGVIVIALWILKLIFHF